MRQIQFRNATKGKKKHPPVISYGLTLDKILAIYKYKGEKMAYFNLTEQLTDHMSSFIKKPKDVDAAVTRIKKAILSLEDRPYWVVGYGSIINKRSREKTFPDAMKTSACTVSGWQRVFDLSSSKGSYANVRENAEHSFNGIAVKVAGEDMIDFVLRESNYDLVDVKAVLADNTEVDAKIVVAKVNKDAEQPRLDYVQAIVNGMSGLSGKDGVMKFLENSYLADGVTTLKEWMENLDLAEYAAKYDSNY